MPSASPATVAALHHALADPTAAQRYWQHVRPADTTTTGACLLWTGAIAGNGHGRFWLGVSAAGRDVCMIAHRFRWALAYGAESLLDVDAIRHDCDVTLCQNLDHLRGGTVAANRQDWANRRDSPGSPLHDRRGPRARARALRDAARAGGDLNATIRAGLTPLDTDQLPLWEE